MNLLRFGNQNQLFQPMPAPQSTKFSYIELDSNASFKADNKEYVHLFFLLEGEVKTSGVKTDKPLITPNEFFFIPNSLFVCRALKPSKFILFSVYRAHYQANKSLYEDLAPVVSKFRHDRSPLQVPPLLSLFMEILSGYLQDGLDTCFLQLLKREELFFILSHLYAKKTMYAFRNYHRLSLS